MSKEAGKLANLGNVEGLSPQVLHQIKLVAKAIGEVETTVENHHERHELDGEDEVGLDASQIVSGLLALARIPTPLKSKILSEVFTAGADITVGQVVAITGDNEVSPADNTLRSQVIGVALNDAAVGEQVEVVIYGKTTVVADGVISAGDPLAAATTAGRVVSLLSHSHTNPNTSSVDLAHTHTNPNTSTTGSHTHSNPSTSSVNLAHTHGVGSLSIGAVGNHRHDCPTTGSAGGHSHGAGTLTADSAGLHSHHFTPEGTINYVSAGTPSGDIVSAGGHKHTQSDTGPPSATVDGITSLIWGTKYAATSSGGSPTQSFYAVKGYSPVTLPSGTHIHSNPDTDVAGAHVHTFNGDALLTHSHTFTGTAKITSSNGAHGHDISGSTASVGSHTHSVGYTTYAGGHSHSITGSTGSSLGSHSHTQGSTGSAGSHHHTQGSTGSTLGLHLHTQDPTGSSPNATIVGKALENAVAGGSLSILVCLAG